VVTQASLLLTSVHTKNNLFQTIKTSWIYYNKTTVLEHKLQSLERSNSIYTAVS